MRYNTGSELKSYTIKPFKTELDIRTNIEFTDGQICDIDTEIRLEDTLDRKFLENSIQSCGYVLEKLHEHNVFEYAKLVLIDSLDYSYMYDYTKKLTDMGFTVMCITSTKEHVRTLIAYTDDLEKMFRMLDNRGIQARASDKIIDYNASSFFGVVLAFETKIMNIPLIHDYNLFKCNGNDVYGRRLIINAFNLTETTSVYTTPNNRLTFNSCKLDKLCEIYQGDNYSYINIKAIECSRNSDTAIQVKMHTLRELTLNLKGLGAVALELDGVNYGDISVDDVYIHGVVNNCKKLTIQAEYIDLDIDIVDDIYDSKASDIYEEKLNALTYKEKLSDNYEEKAEKLYQEARKAVASDNITREEITDTCVDRLLSNLKYIKLYCTIHKISDAIKYHILSDDEAKQVCNASSQYRRYGRISESAIHMFDTFKIDGIEVMDRVQAAHDFLRNNYFYLR